MSREKHFFNFSNWVFWIILGVIVFLALPFFKNGFFDDTKSEEWVSRFQLLEKRADDTTAKSGDTLQKVKNLVRIDWAWSDYSGTNYSISFNVEKDEFGKAAKFREEYAAFFSKSDIYIDFIRISEPVLDSMITAMKKDMEKRGLVGLAMMNYVVSAIQTPPYTKITVKNECPCFDMGRYWLNDCNPRKDGKGCCNNIVPFALYTPTEFVFKKTGDCDTKSVIAYAILKKLQFDAAVIVGDTEGGSHAMLGVANVQPVIPSKYVVHNGTIFYPWEATSFQDDAQLGNMRMWDVWKGWHVVCD